MEKEETKNNGDDDHQISSPEKRSFLKLALAISLLAAVGGIGSVARAISAPAGSPTTSATSTSTSTSGGGSSTSSVGTTSSGSNGYPRTLVATLSSLQVNQPVYFNYPLNDESEASILVKLGIPAKDGVGPDGDIVAYSEVCQHLGCIYAFIAPGTSPKCSSYSASGPVGYCCCHGSIYDFTNDAKVLSGPAPNPVPRVVLDVDSSGNIYAVGMSGANIYGHPNGDLALA